jgi:hypothetical protein
VTALHVHQGSLQSRCPPDSTLPENAHSSLHEVDVNRTMGIGQGGPLTQSANDGTRAVGSGAGALRW